MGADPVVAREELVSPRTRQCDGHLRPSEPSQLEGGDRGRVGEGSVKRSAYIEDSVLEPTPKRLDLMCHPQGMCDFRRARAFVVVASPGERDSERGRVRSRGHRVAEY
jgi:hypothetical protein